MTLSQCMIVKNEEQNIARALSWGQSIVCEQIVVDTGSSDATVEIAKSMGAKVLHYEWHDDFAGAKNYAIDNAGGDWIAFLDADEFILDSDIDRIIPFLESVHNSKKKKKVKAVFCPLINVGSNGLHTGVYPLIRFFRNSDDVRYIGRIHENLSVDKDNCVATEDFKVLHTGYSKEAFKDAEKIERNIRILREDIIQYPDEINLKAYLAETITAGVNTGVLDAGYINEANVLYRQVISSIDYVEPNLKKSAYINILNEYLRLSEPDEYLDKTADNAIAEFPDDVKIMCLYAVAQNIKENYRLAFEVLSNCEIILSNEINANPDLSVRNMSLFASALIQTARGLRDLRLLIKGTVFVLMLDKNNIEALKMCISSFISGDIAVMQILDVLSEIYDLRDKNDLLLIAKAAKDVGAVELARTVINMGS